MQNIKELLYMFLSSIILLLYSVTIHCSELCLPPSYVKKNLLNNILFFCAEQKKTSVYNYNTKKYEETIVIGLDAVKRLKELKLVRKAFIDYIDTMFKIFPLVCCDSLIIPCVPFAPKTPIVHIKFNAPNEYEINLKLYFKTSLEYDNNGYLFVQWKYETTFNQNSIIKKILDNHGDEIVYNARSQIVGPSRARSHYLQAIKALISDIQNDPDCTKHYFYFAKHFKNIGLPFYGRENISPILLKCLNKNLTVLDRGGCCDNIFLSDVFIKSTYIDIQIANPIVIFSLKALNDRPLLYLGIDPFLIKPILDQHIITLNQSIEKLKSSDISLLLKAVQKCIKKMHLIEHCLKKLSNKWLTPEQKNIINSLNANLHNAKDLFLNAFFKKYTPTNNNVIEMWLWKKTHIFIKYLIEKNESLITNQAEVKKTIAKMFTIIKVVLSLNNSKEEAILAQKRSFTAWETIVLYFQKQIFNIYEKKLSSDMIDTLNSNDRFFDKIYAFFRFCDFKKDNTVKGRLTLERRTAMTMTPDQCKYTRIDLEQKLQKQLQDKEDRKKEEEKVHIQMDPLASALDTVKNQPQIHMTNNLFNNLPDDGQVIKRIFFYTIFAKEISLENISILKKWFCSLPLVCKKFAKTISSTKEFFINNCPQTVLIVGDETLAKNKDPIVGKKLASITIQADNEYTIQLQALYNSTRYEYASDPLLLYWTCNIKFDEKSRLMPLISQIMHELDKNVTLETTELEFKSILYGPGDDARDSYIDWLTELHTQNINEHNFIFPNILFILNLLIHNPNINYDMPGSCEVYRPQTSFSAIPFIMPLNLTLSIKEPMKRFSLFVLKESCFFYTIVWSDESIILIHDILELNKPTMSLEEIEKSEALHNNTLKNINKIKDRQKYYETYTTAEKALNSMKNDHAYYVLLEKFSDHFAKIKLAQSKDIITCNSNSQKPNSAKITIQFILFYDILKEITHKKIEKIISFTQKKIDYDFKKETIISAHQKTIDKDFEQKNPNIDRKKQTPEIPTLFSYKKIAIVTSSAICLLLITFFTAKLALENMKNLKPASAK